MKLDFSFGPEFDEHCPVGDPDGSKGDPAPNMHCTCWYDGDGCCRCKAVPLTEEQMRAQGMLDEAPQSEEICTCGMYMDSQHTQDCPGGFV